MPWKDPNRKRQYERDYSKKNRDRIRANFNRYSWKLKRRVLEFLGGVKCVVCGITDIRILTIHHKNGGGRDEVRTRGRSLRTWYFDIISGRRTKDDLEVRCYNCNILGEYERGKLKLPV